MVIAKENRCDNHWCAGLFVVQCALKHAHTGPLARVQGHEDKVPAVLVW